MKKLLLGLLLSVGVVMVSEAAKDDLLSMATMGKTSGIQTQMSRDEMKDADGGYYSRYTGIGSSYYNRNTIGAYSSGSRSSIYARAFGSYYWGRTY